MTTIACSRHRLRLGALGVSLAFMSFGCAGRETAAVPPADKEAEDVAEQLSESPGGTVEAQVARGADLFDKVCDRCHGQRGEGMDIIVDAPQILGPGALGPHGTTERKFQTAQALFTFISEEMPADSPGELPDREYWDVTAYVLYANEVPLTEQVGPENAEQIDIDAAAPAVAARPLDR